MVDAFAMTEGTRPSRSGTLGSARASKSSLQMEWCAFSTAKCSAETPWCVQARGEAAAASKRRMRRDWPRRAHSRRRAPAPCVSMGNAIAASTKVSLESAPKKEGDLEPKGVGES
eukprot:1863905-Pleurochrysis_carterae.AAC.1